MPPFDAATGSGPKPPQEFYSPWGDPSKDKRKGLWAVLFVVVFLGHGLLLVGADEIPEKKKQTRVEMALVKPPPPPPPPPPEVVEEKPQPKKRRNRSRNRNLRSHHRPQILSPLQSHKKNRRFLSLVQPRILQ